MGKEQLLIALKELSIKSSDKWMSGLEKRKLEELRFHDHNRDKNLISDYDEAAFERFHGNKKFYGTVGLSTNYVDSWIKNHSKGRVFLDYACGNGVNAIKAAKAGADLVVGLDISSVSVENASKSAKAAGVSNNTYFIQGDCENTGLPDQCIDICVCSGMLHHLDLSYAFPELRRILKEGGVILAIEAIDYNPLIKIYRNMTPQMRTEWEAAHILSFKDIVFAERFFEVRNIKYWHLFSIAGAYIPFILPLLNLIDNLILRLPILRMMAWMFTFELYKRENKY